MNQSLLIVADESVDFSIITFLREQEIEVYAITEEKPSISDSEVLLLAFKKKAILLTEDKDFGELSIRLNQPNHGILLLRLSGLNTEKKCQLVIESLKRHGSKMKDHFSVVTKDKIRIRRKSNL